MLSAVVDVNRGSQVVRTAEVRRSHASFERIARKLDSPGSPGPPGTELAVTGNQVP